MRMPPPRNHRGRGGSHARGTSGESIGMGMGAGSSTGATRANDPGRRKPKPRMVPGSVQGVSNATDPATPGVEKAAPGHGCQTAARDTRPRRADSRPVPVALGQANGNLHRRRAPKRPPENRYGRVVVNPERELQVVGCPRREYWIEPPVCRKMQAERRAKCERVNRGNGCQWLDSIRVLGEPAAEVRELAPVEAVIEQFRSYWQETRL